MLETHKRTMHIEIGTDELHAFQNLVKIEKMMESLYPHHTLQHWCMCDEEHYDVFSN